MHTEILEAIKAVATTKPSGKVTSTEVADYMGVDRSKIMRPITELVKDGLAIRHNNYYSMPEEHTAAAPEPVKTDNLPPAVAQKPKNQQGEGDFGWMGRTMGVESMKENVEPEVAAVKVLSESKALTAINDLEKKLKHQVVDKPLKVEVLNRLAELLSSDIGSVLNEIIDDLEAV